VRQRKWVGVAVVVALVGTIASVWWVSRSSVVAFEQNSVAKAQQYLLTISQTAAQRLGVFIGDIEKETRLVAQNPSVVRAAEEGLSAQDVLARDGYSLEVTTFDDHLDGVSSLCRLNAKGIVQSSLPPGSRKIGEDLSRLPGVSDVLDHHKRRQQQCPSGVGCDCASTAFTSHVFATESGKSAVSICAPMFERDRLVGIICALVYTETINEQIDEIHAGEKGYAQIFDDDGIMLAHPDRTQIGTDILAVRRKAFPSVDWSEMETLLTRMSEGETGVAVYHSAWWNDDDLRIVKKLVGFSPVRVGRELWSLAVTMGYDEIAEPIYSQTRTMFVAASLMLLALLGAGAGFYQSEKKKAALLFETQTNQRLRDEIAVRKQAEEELRSAKKSAEDANKAKSEFLANMSHEIRTPMTAILGFSENLLDGDLSESEKLNTIHTIRRNGDSLLSIINDILDLSKIEAGKMTTDRKVCQPCRIVAEVASLMRVPADAKGLPFDIEYIGAVPETIQSDPTRLRQILINLIGNAIKFTEVGSVRLVIRLVDDGGAPFVQFDVIDTGRGMSPEQVAKLFRPFTQANTSTTREYGGTGLGLTISKRFAELLDGKIAMVATEIGVGTTFRVSVPTGALDGVRMLEDAMATTVVADTTGDERRVGPSALRGLRVLLAEDGPDNQRLISFVLKKAGADVTIKENGKLALDAALAARDEGNSFDCILMDMQMPVMDGYAATEQLRQKNYAGTIIALTAHAMTSDREKCIEAGCDDYATKPIDRRKLIETIQQQLLHADAMIPLAT